jgi:hypothetical protein
MNDILAKIPAVLDLGCQVCLIQGSITVYLKLEINSDDSAIRDLKSIVEKNKWRFDAMFPDVFGKADLLR